MRSLIYLLLLLAAHHCLCAQNFSSSVSVRNSDVIELNDLGYPNGGVNIGQGQSIFTFETRKLSSKKVGLALVKVDTSAEILEQRIAISPDENLDLDFGGLLYLKGQLHLFGTEAATNTAPGRLFAIPYDKEYLRPSGLPRFITSFEKDSHKNGRSVHHAPGWKNESYVIASVASNDLKGKKEVNFMLLDGDAKVAKSKKVTIEPQGNGRLYIIDIVYTENGYLYLLTKEEKKKSARNTTPEGRFFVHRFSFSDVGEKFFEVELGEHKIGNCGLSLTDYNTVVLTGRLCHPKNASIALGYFHEVLTEDNFDDITPTLIPFEIGEDYGLTLGSAPASKTMGFKSLSQYNSVRKVLTIKDGGTFIVGAQLYSDTKTYDDRFITYRHTRNIVVTFLNSAGRPEWVKTIPMHCRNEVQALARLKVFKREDEVIIVFNDHERNLENPDRAPEMQIWFKNSVQRVVGINTSGELKDYALDILNPVKKTLYLSEIGTAEWNGDFLIVPAMVGRSEQCFSVIKF